jgi:RNA polymerase sigma-70 factor (family 1)
VVFDKRLDKVTPAILERRLDDDRALFRQIAFGDEYAFQQFFERYRSRLLSYLIRVIKFPEDAEELTQEIFLKVWINREFLAEVESPSHYIFVMARNKAVDYLRKSALDSRLRQELWKIINAHQNPIEEQVFADDSARLINEAIFKLSHQKQAVFRLSRMEGLTHDQIAVQLSISKNTVKNHIGASVKFIKNYLIHH